MNYAEAKEILRRQPLSEEINENLKQIYRSDEDIVFKFFDAYYLGMINGKRAERARRAQR